MSTTPASARFTTLPDQETLESTIVALEEHGFSVEVGDDLDAAREAVLARLPEGSSVMTNTSVASFDGPFWELLGYFRSHRQGASHWS